MLYQLSYFRFFRFFSAITSSDFTLSFITTARLLRHSSFVFLVLPKNKLQNSSFLKGVFFVELPLSVGHYREVTPSFFVRSPQIRSSINSGFSFSNETVVRFRLKLWEKMDSNHRRYKPGRRWIRTTEGINQQIYSLPHLATLVFSRFFVSFVRLLRWTSHRRSVIYSSKLLPSSFVRL